LEEEPTYKPPKIIELTEEEFVRLLISIFFDFVELAFPILLGPIIGDVLDLIGATVGFILFGWIGVINLLELIPFADYIPLFIISWIVWFYLKRKRERRELERIKKQFI